MAQKADLELPVGRRHIVERPRLTRLLHETSARVVMLVAPAGYGKTTLARQWLSDKPHAWYQASTASTDAAALAAGLVESSLVQPSSPKLNAWLATTGEPQLEINTLARVLAEDLSGWPTDAWLAIDDYHLLASRGSEDLVNLLLECTTFPVLISSRARPKWATPRRLLYGELAEFGQHALAMNDAEAIDVLSQSDSAAARALVGLANGWPAVIGLASFADLSVLLEQDGLPVDLHDYVAEELFSLLDEGTQVDLCRLALLPELTRSLLEEVPRLNTDVVVPAGQRAGFLVSTSASTLELHPLLRGFLLEKLERLDKDFVNSSVDEAVRLLLRTHYWEDAFILVCRFDRVALLDAVVSESLDELVEHGRTETLKQWVDAGRAKHFDSPALDLLEADYCFRAGRHDRAMILAERAGGRIGDDSRLTSRAFYRAGQNAHLTDSPHDALRYFGRARQAAKTTRDMQDALWGEFITTVELERDGAGILHEFEASSSGSLDELVRIHNGWLYLATRQGNLPQAIDNARAIADLVCQARDPVVRVSFLHIYSAALRLTTDYDEARMQVDFGLREADSYHLEFAKPHMLLTLAAVCIGVGEYAKASAVLAQADRLSSSNRDEYLSMSTAATRCRLLLLEGAPDKALAMTNHPWPGVRARGQRAEFLASRALALIFSGDRHQARAVLDGAASLSKELEPVTLCDWTSVLLALQDDEPDALEHLEQTFERTRKAGLTDTFVFAYRVEPRILALLTRTGRSQDQITQILTHANDRSRGEAAGIHLPEEPLRPRTLTPRETEVFELLCEGRSNKEIARSLFLSEVTVKVHVRSILRKLGVRTRTEAAVLGARTRVH
jgi:LuxR family transcriptional regulator, maltose regulon positive regulatory protein